LLFGPEENVTGRKTKQKRSELWAKVKRERREHNTQAEPPTFFDQWIFFLLFFSGLPLTMLVRRMTKEGKGHAGATP